MLVHPHNQQKEKHDMIHSIRPNSHFRAPANHLMLVHPTDLPSDTENDRTFSWYLVSHRKLHSKGCSGLEPEKLSKGVKSDTNTL